MIVKNKICVAAVQATPVLFNLDATVDKTLKLAKEAAKRGAQLVLFPEAFLSAYPRGLAFGTVVGARSAEGRIFWQKYWDSCLDVESMAFERLSRCAKDNNIYLAVGANERNRRNGTIYCSLLLFNPEGALIAKHRKIKPTAAERLIWGEGDGRSLQAISTSLGRVGGLICWENYMPLARYRLYDQGVQIYLAPTADARDSWQATLTHIACEGRCFVLGCNQYVEKKDYPREWRAELVDQSEVMCRGGSAIISPLGETLVGPHYGGEEILIAELDRREIIRSKLDFDPIGHYQRPDLFDFSFRPSSNENNWKRP